MSPITETTLIGGGFTIIGVLIGSFIGYYSSTRLINRQNFNKAAADFRNAFLSETTFLKHDANIGGLSSSNRLNGILRDSYLRQLKALEIFKSSLSTAKIKAIDRAWDEYCHPNGIPKDPNKKRDSRFNDYMEIEESKGIEKAKEVALQKINNILKFAEHK